MPASLCASFLASRTVTPLLALRLMTPEKPVGPASRSLRDRLSLGSRDFFTWIEERYARLIEWALTHPRLVVGSTAGAFVASLLLVSAPSLGLGPLIGTESFPASVEAQFRINLQAPACTRVEE